MGEDWWRETGRGTIGFASGLRGEKAEIAEGAEGAESIWTARSARTGEKEGMNRRGRTETQRR